MVHMDGTEIRTVGIVKEKAVNFLQEDAGFGMVVITTIAVTVFVAVMDILL